MLLIVVAWPLLTTDCSIFWHFTQHLSVQELHQQFELPDDWPYFRRVSAYQFPNETYKDGYLRNPHQVLTHPSLDQGKVQPTA